ncbi:FkbM family methyltransferase, partial [Candidatus Poribacteria bacterium]|nr:FkbM family methyltransferase [Candidatus Poribacteria bacterium]
RQKRVAAMYGVSQVGQPVTNVRTNLGFTMRGPVANDAMRQQLAPFSVDAPYEPIEVFLTLLATHDGGTYFDIGANLGYFSLVAACNRAVGAPLVVHAFEPAPFYHDLLRRNILGNRLSRIVKPHALALAGSAGEQTLHLFDTSSSLDATWAQETRGQGPLGTQAVPTAALDDLFDPSDLLAPFIFKIDVEGSEMAVLRGGARLLQSSESAFVLVEAHHDSQEQHAVLRLLTDWGYTCLGLARYTDEEYLNVWNDKLVTLDEIADDPSLWCGYWMCLREGHQRAAEVISQYGLYPLFVSTRYLDSDGLADLLAGRQDDAPDV